MKIKILTEGYRKEFGNPQNLNGFWTFELLHPLTFEPHWVELSRANFATDAGWEQQILREKMTAEREAVEFESRLVGIHGVYTTDRMKRFLLRLFNQNKYGCYHGLSHLEAVVVRLVPMLSANGSLCNPGEKL